MDEQTQKININFVANYIFKGMGFWGFGAGPCQLHTVARGNLEGVTGGGANFARPC